ncbi:MAG: hypothetical protein R3266_12540, partial [Gemmatimonadota bacterium]|nr:hypothetical protein [Gemmatimonadota bacterium]
MRRRISLIPCLALLVGASALGAQDLEEVCPDSDEGTGALWGLLADADSEMGLPGATVRATWEADGNRGSAEAQTGFDGSYTLCYLPLETELSVAGVFGNMAGQPVSVTLTEPITRTDLMFSLAAEGGGEAAGDRIWGCIGQEGSQLRVETASLL